MAAASESFRGFVADPRGRFVTALVSAAAITFALYWVMQSLIAMSGGAFDEGFRGQVLEFVRLRRDETLRTKDRKPERPPEPEKAPDVPPLQPDAGGPADSVLGIGPMGHQVSLDRGLGMAVGEGDYLPIVKVAPIYPMRARERGIEGWVMLEFTVTKTGTVKDPVVLESKPSGIFDRAAKQAALKFKYKPRVVGGQALEVPGVRHRIVFELED